MLDAWFVVFGTISAFSFAAVLLGVFIHRARKEAADIERERAEPRFS